MARLDVELLLSGHGEMISGARQVRSNFERIEQYWFGFV
jgi:hypothetical protein